MDFDHAMDFPSPVAHANLCQPPLLEVHQESAGATRLKGVLQRNLEQDSSVWIGWWLPPDRHISLQ